MRTPAPGSLPVGVDAFLAHVEALAPATWLAIGEREPVDDAVLAPALLILEAALGDASREADAWLVRDAVHTLAWIAERRLGRLDRRRRKCLTAARDHIERAALARIVVDTIPGRDLRALCSATVGWLPSPTARPRPLRGSAEEAELDLL